MRVLFINTWSRLALAVSGAWVLIGVRILWAGVAGIAGVFVAQRSVSAEIAAHPIYSLWWITALAQFSIGLLGIIGAVALLRKVRWGRVTLEVLSWLALAYLLTVCVIWLHVRNFDVGIGEGIRALLPIGAFLFLLWALRSKAIRNSLSAAPN